MNSRNSVFADSKNHYEILDGLRGVAALAVVLFHILEIFSGGDHTKQIINHGYLAVDFFFALSGFVIGHAYDDRWHKMSLAAFFKRRLIRLHPMIIAGMVIGAIGFYFAASTVLFPAISQTPVWKMLLVLLIGITLLPVPLALDIRGWTEMHPLNGPAWSLFFEYIANIFYALILRKLPNAVLAVLALVAGALLIQLAVSSGDIIGGWSLEPAQLRIGFTRLAYPFLAGLLLSRIFKPGRINYAFGICSFLLLLILAFPRLGGHEQLWMNGLYDSLSVIILFPLVLFTGASGEIKNPNARKLCNFLGDISYPLYITHYPLIYIFSAWVVNNSVPMSKAWLAGVCTFAGAIVLAYICFRFYDLPVRKWLSKKFIR